MEIYGIPGLGGDKRLYGDLMAYIPEIQPLDFLPPQNRRESLKSYARRMVAHYQIPKGSVIMGVSFGGAIAQEMAKQQDLDLRVILLSSMTDYREIRQPLRFYGQIGAYWLINRLVLGIPWFYLSIWFDQIKPREADLLNRMARNGRIRFLRWGAWQASRYRNTDFSRVITRIHGTRDNMFPKPLHLEPQWVEGASHFMILTHPQETAEKIIESMKKLS